MRRFQRVTGLASKTYTEENLDEMARSRQGLPDWQQRTAMWSDRELLLGRTFVFEQLACGCLGECLGIAGQPDVSEPAKRRICDSHDGEDEG